MFLNFKIFYFFLFFFYFFFFLIIIINKQLNSNIQEKIDIKIREKHKKKFKDALLFDLLNYQVNDFIDFIKSYFIY